MALLTGSQLGEIMRDMENLATTRVIPINYTKAQLFAALQAVEDWFESQKTTVSGLINTATSPLVMTVAQKKLLVKLYLKEKYNTE